MGNPIKRYGEVIVTTLLWDMRTFNLYDDKGDHVAQQKRRVHSWGSDLWHAAEAFALLHGYTLEAMEAS